MFSRWYTFNANRQLTLASSALCCTLLCLIKENTGDLKYLPYSKTLKSTICSYFVYFTIFFKIRFLLLNVNQTAAVCFCQIKAMFLSSIYISICLLELVLTLYFCPLQINGIVLDNKSLSECESLLRSCHDSLSISLMKVKSSDLHTPQKLSQTPWRTCNQKKPFRTTFKDCVMHLISVRLLNHLSSIALLLVVGRRYFIVIAYYKDNNILIGISP